MAKATPRAKPYFKRNAGVSTIAAQYSCVLCWDTPIAANMPCVCGGRAGIICVSCARDIKRMDLTLKQLQAKRKAKRKAKR